MVWRVVVVFPITWQIQIRFYYTSFSNNVTHLCYLLRIRFPLRVKIVNMSLLIYTILDKSRETHLWGLPNVVKHLVRLLHTLIYDESSFIWCAPYHWFCPMFAKTFLTALGTKQKNSFTAWLYLLYIVNFITVFYTYDAKVVHNILHTPYMPREHSTPVKNKLSKKEYAKLYQ